MNAEPALLIIEHPGARLSGSDVRALEALVGPSRSWVLRPSGCASLDVATLFYESLDDTAPLDVLPEDVGDLHIVLAGFGEHERLPLGWMRYFSALQVHTIRRVVEAELGDGAATGDQQTDRMLVDHRPRADHVSGVLSVFPGPIVPTVMGSHQRAYGVLEALTRNGIACDLLLTCPRPPVADRARTLLSQLSPIVHVNGASGRKLPPHLLARQGIEMGLRRLAGIQRPAPRLFEERLHTAAAFSGRVKLRRLLEARQYHTVIVNYAWMEPIRALLPPPLVEAHQWICDTHDVQFIRTETHNEGEVRFAASNAREKRLELDVLRSFDHVLAISPSDAEILRQHLPGARVLEVPTGFDYALQAPRRPDPERPVFGFIGGGMDANVKAVKLLLDSWWPAVIHRWPKARLRVAGTIASNREVTTAAFLVPGVEMVGYVNSLRGFYGSIDALLNPVVVQGGLNFKAVESLMAGRLVVTTEIGARCLGDPDLSVVASSGDQVVAKVGAALHDPPDYVAGRAKTTQEARRRFGDDVAYAALTSLFSERFITAAKKTQKQGCLRVLMQVGDHYENWARTVRLAIAIRERGHHPIALLYGQEGYNFFLANGIDVASLYQYNEPAGLRESRKLYLRIHKKLVPRFHRHYDLEDLAAAEGAAPGWTEEMALASRRNTISHVHRCEKLLDAVRPDVLLVWNGYTGIIANVLRQSASIRGLGLAFLERSLLSNAAFVDRRGVNGYSSLCDRTMDEILAYDAQGPSASLVTETIPEVSPRQVDELRRAGPWRSAKKIIFVPLQVESDTNLRLHSPTIRSMNQLVQAVWNEHHDENTAIVVRPHPEERATVQLSKLPGTYIDSQGDLNTWLEVASLVVTVNSTVGLTALLRGRPVSALGRSIYSGKGIARGAVPDAGEVEAYVRYLLGVHTACGYGLPADLEPLLPQQERHEEWRAVHPTVTDIVGWYERWREFASQVREHATQTRRLTIETDVRPGDTLDLTYRTLEAPLTRDWMSSRAREVFGLDRSIALNVTRSDELDGGATSTAERIIVSQSPRATNGYVLDKYFAPWAPDTK